jgi:SAM-dependent methyltransferase
MRFTVSRTVVAEPSSRWARTAIRRACETVSCVDTGEFVLSQLPPPPARVLEVGTGGEGELALELDGAGYDLVAIDPAAPQDGGIFRRIKLEELDADELFHGVVAVRVLHHITDLAAGLDRIRDHLRPGGALVLEEIGWDLMDEPTAEWLWEQQQERPSSARELLREWDDEHVGLHGFDAMRAELGSRFRERFFSWEPFLYKYLEDRATAVSLERSLIEADAIRAIGWRYAGETR